MISKLLPAFLLPALFLLCFVTEAQNLKSDKVIYTYTRPPLQHLDKSIEHYVVRLVAPYEEKNRRLTEEYQSAKKTAADAFMRETLAYPQQVQAADATYDKELEAYNKKTPGTRIVEKALLNESTKPVKTTPPKPYLQTVPLPALQTTYDLPVLATTYFHLNGYQPNPVNAVVIQVTLYGFDYTQPRVLSEQRDMVRLGGGPTSTYKATYYHTEFSYRHPMAVSVTLPGGRELLNLTPAELNNYKIWTSTPSDNYIQTNNEALVRSTEEKTLQENVAFINNLINDKFGFSPVRREAELSYVKSKEDVYADLMLALNEASSGLLLLQQNEGAAKTKLKKAAAVWQAALPESDLSNKKARINKEVTLAIYFNLLETYFALVNTKDAKTILEKLNGLPLSGNEKKRKNEYALLFADLETRTKTE